MKTFLNLSVCIMHEDGTYEALYDHIPTWEEADLIAQYAMQMRTSAMDLIFVFPGCNRGIDADPKMWAKASALAQKYVCEHRKETKHEHHTRRGHAQG